jgi:hypothetical protein
LNVEHCPHCKGDLPRPNPRVCTHCGGSLQVRYMTSGCLTSAPKLFVLGAAGFGVWRLAREIGRALDGL